MPARVHVTDTATGQTLDAWRIDAAEMVARDPGRYSIVPGTEHEHRGADAHHAAVMATREKRAASPPDPAQEAAAAAERQRNRHRTFRPSGPAEHAAFTAAKRSGDWSTIDDIERRRRAAGA